MAPNLNRNLAFFGLLTETEQGIKIMMKSRIKRGVFDLGLH
jgi:hypothetical protein